MHSPFIYLVFSDPMNLLSRIQCILPHLFSFLWSSEDIMLNPMHFPLIYFVFSYTWHIRKNHGQFYKQIRILNEYVRKQTKQKHVFTSTNV
jgi:hypothetical protein